MTDDQSGQQPTPPADGGMGQPTTPTTPPADGGMGEPAAPTEPTAPAGGTM